MSSLIRCPGCKHQLTLPEATVGKLVQCPACLIEFDAHLTPMPLLEVEPLPTAPEAKPTPGANERAPANAPFERTAISTAGRPRAEKALFYCTLCGTKLADNDDACPGCGYRFQDSFDDRPEERRQSARRKLQPIQSMLPILGAVLLAVGILVMIGTLIVAETFVRRPGPRDVICFFGVGAGLLIELAALICCFLWLYQAWRFVLRGDEEYTPGLMVGLLFVPFFNCYWIFRAIPGLSAAIQEELEYLAPARTHGAGRAVALIACVVALIPYAQPIAFCLFLAWMLIANNALNRIIRYHEKLEEKFNAPG